MSKYQNIKNAKDFKNFRKCQEICKKFKKISITLENPKTSKTKCKKNAFIDFENGVIVKIYKS